MKYLIFKKNHLIIIITLIIGVMLLFLSFHNQIKNISTGVFLGKTNDKATREKSTTQNKDVDKEKSRPLRPIAQNNSSQTKTNKKEFFIEYRMERDRNRDRQIELLKEVVNNDNSGDEARKEAQKRILNISGVLEKEMELENLVKARGYKDAVAMIQDKGLTIVVQIPNLTAEDTARITDAAEQCTGFDRAKIVVLAKM